MNGIKVAGSDAQVTKLDFCSVSLLLAVGNECGLVTYLSYYVSLSDTMQYLFCTYFLCFDDFNRFAFMTSKATLVDEISIFSQKQKVKVIPRCLSPSWKATF